MIFWQILIIYQIRVSPLKKEHVSNIFFHFFYFKDGPLYALNDEKYSEIVSKNKGNNVTIFYIREEKSCKIDTCVQLYVDRSQL